MVTQCLRRSDSAVWFQYVLFYCCQISWAPRLRCCSDISCTLHGRALSQSLRISTFSMRSRRPNRWGSIAHHERPINERQQGRRGDDKGPPHATQFCIWIQYCGLLSPYFGYFRITLFEYTDETEEGMQSVAGRISV